VAFQDYVQGFPRVEVLGFKDRREVLACLDSADVLVLPNSAKNPLSLYTSPLKLFEYMAARKPIVAARIASLQEILRDGENAILFEPDDPQDLAKKISQALENDCRLLVDRAWQDVQTCTWDRRAEQIIQWMKERGALKDEYLLAAEAKDL
jgi:glycosyltransferase involved in cell wall biosynthesis